MLETQRSESRGPEGFSWFEWGKFWGGLLMGCGCVLAWSAWQASGSLVLWGLGVLNGVGAFLLMSRSEVVREAS